jgi:SAM-dependent methyltransferase
MSFTPLPKIFTDLCQRSVSPSPRILELGCGDGRFRDVLADHGISCWGLDLIGPEGGSVADVVGEARNLPVAPGSLDLLLVPNLLRHLAPADPALGFLDVWLEVLKPGGFLFIFEDEPVTEPHGAAHYRDLQEFLSRLMPESRGPLLSLAEFRARLAARGKSSSWIFGTARNLQTLDGSAVLAFLDPESGSSAEIRNLQAGIRRDGLDPGVYWWARAAVGAE